MSILKKHKTVVITYDSKDGRYTGFYSNSRHTRESHSEMYQEMLDELVVDKNSDKFQDGAVVTNVITI